MISESDLNSLTRKELQYLCKELGVKANGKTKEMRKSIGEKFTTNVCFSAEILNSFMSRRRESLIIYGELDETKADVLDDSMFLETSELDISVLHSPVHQNPDSQERMYEVETAEHSDVPRTEAGLISSPSPVDFSTAPIAVVESSIQMISEAGATLNSTAQTKAETSINTKAAVKSPLPNADETDTMEATMRTSPNAVVNSAVQSVEDTTENFTASETEGTMSISANTVPTCSFQGVDESESTENSTVPKTEAELNISPIEVAKSPLQIKTISMEAHELGCYSSPAGNSPFKVPSNTSEINPSHNLVCSPIQDTHASPQQIAASAIKEPKTGGKSAQRKKCPDFDRIHDKIFSNQKSLGEYSAKQKRKTAEAFSKDPSAEKSEKRTKTSDVKAQTVFVSPSRIQTSCSKNSAIKPRQLCSPFGSARKAEAGSMLFSPGRAQPTSLAKKKPQSVICSTRPDTSSTAVRFEKAQGSFENDRSVANRNLSKSCSKVPSASMKTSQGFSCESALFSPGKLQAKTCTKKFKLSPHRSPEPTKLVAAGRTPLTLLGKDAPQKSPPRTRNPGSIGGTVASRPCQFMIKKSEKPLTLVKEFNLSSQGSKPKGFEFKPFSGKIPDLTKDVASPQKLPVSATKPSTDSNRTGKEREFRKSNIGIRDPVKKSLVQTNTARTKQRAETFAVQAKTKRDVAVLSKRTEKKSVLQK